MITPESIYLSFYVGPKPNHQMSSPISFYFCELSIKVRFGLKTNNCNNLSNTNVFKSKISLDIITVG